MAVLTAAVVAPPPQPQVEFFSNEVMIHPVTNRPEHKRSFIPSLVEKEKVSKLVHAIKMGWIKPRRVEDPSRGSFFDLWAGEDASILAKHRMHLPAPKTPLPGHHESYNPPPEYLLSEEEVGAHARVSQQPGGAGCFQAFGSLMTLKTVLTRLLTQRGSDCKGGLLF